MAKPIKITWDIIHDDFRRRYPITKKMELYWRPHDYATIVVYLNNGDKLLYDYDTKTMTRILKPTTDDSLS